jgi:methyl-accepting chemotaxis protein
LVLGLGTTVTGCGEQKKVKECNAFVTVINSGVDRVTKTINTVPDSGAAVSELRSLADEMDAISAETKKVELSLPDLQRISDQYQKMVTDIAAAARELAEAVDSVDREAVTKAQGTLDQAVKREGPLVEELNKFCQNP